MYPLVSEETFNGLRLAKVDQSKFSSYKNTINLNFMFISSLKISAKLFILSVSFISVIFNKQLRPVYKSLILSFLVVVLFCRQGFSQTLKQKEKNVKAFAQLF